MLIGRKTINQINRPAATTHTIIFRIAAGEKITLCIANETFKTIFSSDKT